MRRIVVGLGAVSGLLMAATAFASNLSGIDIWEWWNLWWLYVNGSNLWRI